MLIEGLPQLRRALDQSEHDTKQVLRQGLIEAAEPVKQEAQALAKSAIRNNTERWSQFRTGVSAGGARGVYMVPRYRRRKKGTARKNMGTLLMTRAMLPALTRKADEVTANLDHLLDRMAERFNS